MNAWMITALVAPWACFAFAQWNAHQAITLCEEIRDARDEYRNERDQLQRKLDALMASKGERTD